MIHYGDCLDASMYPTEQADLILFDPPFWPYNQQYKQVRKENLHVLDPIPTPTKERYADWWSQLCQLLQPKLKPTGWFCYKADSWTAKLTFPITNQYFNYSNEVIWNKGRIGLGRYIRTKHEQIEVYMADSSKKKYWKYNTIMDKTPSKWHGGSKGIAFQSIIDDVPNFNNGVLGVKPTSHINQTPTNFGINLSIICVHLMD
jgi:hypothetical protein